VLGVADALGIVGDAVAVAVGVGDADGDVVCCVVVCWVVVGADVLAGGVVLGLADGAADEEVGVVTVCPDRAAVDGCPEAARATPPAADAARSPVITEASASLRPMRRR
jgi:hypothetical protein